MKQSDCTAKCAEITQELIAAAAAAATKVFLTRDSRTSVAIIITRRRYAIYIFLIVFYKGRPAWSEKSQNEIGSFFSRVFKSLCAAAAPAPAAAQVKVIRSGGGRDGISSQSTFKKKQKNFVLL